MQKTSKQETKLGNAHSRLASVKAQWDRAHAELTGLREERIKIESTLSDEGMHPDKREAATARQAEILSAITGATAEFASLEEERKAVVQELSSLTQERAELLTRARSTASKIAGLERRVSQAQAALDDAVRAREAVAEEAADLLMQAEEIGSDEEVER